MSQCGRPCDGCALTPGSKAALEVAPALKAMICVLGGIPFWCNHHDGVDRSAPAYLPRREFHQMIDAGEVRICEGWRRDVRARAAAGELSAMRRALAQAALELLDAFVLEHDGSPEKEELRSELERLLTSLTRAAPARLVPTWALAGGGAE